MPNMTPRKTKQRHQQSSTQSHVPFSDYESEAFYEPNLPTRSNTDLNLSVLRRYHPSIHSILSIAPSAQIYTYVPSTTSWNKTDIEGTLFVCQLAPVGTKGVIGYCVVVINRRGLENLILGMEEIENVEITEQFLMISARKGDAEGEIHTMGFFIHADKLDTRDVNCALIKEKWEEAGTTGNGTSNAEPVRSAGGNGRRLSLTDLFAQSGQ